jgi:hypothetical protein
MQDHTRAELWLALLSAADPNGMFITGDTAQASRFLCVAVVSFQLTESVTSHLAQAIERGVSFRFEDVRSLFFAGEPQPSNWALSLASDASAIHK